MPAVRRDRQRRLFPVVFWERQEPEAMYRAGDRVVYIATKHSAHPSPRAEAVKPEQHGEGYWYDVKKYWLVVGVRPDGLLTVITRRGKERSVGVHRPASAARSLVGKPLHARSLPAADIAADRWPANAVERRVAWAVPTIWAIKLGKAHPTTRG